MPIDNTNGDSPLPAIQVPDYLLAALGQEEVTGTTDIYVENTQATPIEARRIELGQRTGKFASEYGKMVIHDGKSQDGLEVVNHIDFLLLDYLSIDLLTGDDWMRDKSSEVSAGLGAGYVARTLWDTSPNGARQLDSAKPLCTSSNGITAWPSYRNTEILDHRTGVAHKIGVRVAADGTETQAVNTCIGCPLAKEYVETRPDGSTVWHKPLCRQTPMAVLYDIDRKEIVTMKAVNLGMTFAFQGHTGKSGRMWNGEVLHGMRYPFSHIAGGEIEVNGQRVPTFRNRPEGKPSPTNPYAPVYAVRMTVTQNNFNPATAIPQFTVLDGKTSRVKVVDVTARPANVASGNAYIDTPQRQLTLEEYLDYLKKKDAIYVDGNWRSRLMALSLINNDTVTVMPPLPSGDGGAEVYDNPF